jgi:integrase
VRPSRRAQERMCGHATSDRSNVDHLIVYAPRQMVASQSPTHPTVGQDHGTTRERDEYPTTDPLIRYPALPHSEISAFMQTLRSQSGLVAKALELLVLTATKATETLRARPGQFDLDAAVWTLPRECRRWSRRMPLSSAAVDLVRDLKLQPDTRWLFAGRDSKPLSNESVRALLKRLKRNDLTMRDFRVCFITWAVEQPYSSSKICKIALGHHVHDLTVEERAFGDFLETRQRMMQEWADYCAQPPTKGRTAEPRLTTDQVKRA